MLLLLVNWGLVYWGSLLHWRYIFLLNWRDILFFNRGNDCLFNWRDLFFLNWHWWNIFLLSWRDILWLHISIY